MADPDDDKLAEDWGLDDLDGMTSGGTARTVRPTMPWLPNGRR